MDSLKINKKITVIEGEINQKRLLDSVKDVSYNNYSNETVTLNSVNNKKIIKDVKYVYFSSDYPFMMKILGGKGFIQTDYAELLFKNNEEIELIYEDTNINPLLNEDNRVEIIIVR
jgi:hypothetical protein